MKRLANSAASYRQQGHEVNVYYLGFYHGGGLVPTDTLWGGKEHFSYVERKRPTLVTAATQGRPPAWICKARPSLPPHPCQINTAGGGNTGHCPAAWTDRREPQARDGNKATAGSCLPGFPLYHQGAWPTAGPQGVYTARSLECYREAPLCVQ